jgi:hypothetical protein
MKPYVLGREQGEAIWMFDSLDTIKADAERTGGFSVVEFLDFEGSSVPLHVNGPLGHGLLHPRGRVPLRDRGRDGGGIVRIVGVRAAGDSARVALRFTRGAAPERDGARRLRGLLPAGGRERAGSDTVAGTERTGCRSPLEHGRTVQRQDRRATARDVDTGADARHSRRLAAP